MKHRHTYHGSRWLQQSTTQPLKKHRKRNSFTSSRQQQTYGICSLIAFFIKKRKNLHTNTGAVAKDVKEKHDVKIGEVLRKPKECEWDPLTSQRSRRSLLDLKMTAALVDVVLLVIPKCSAGGWKFKRWHTETE